MNIMDSYGRKIKPLKKKELAWTVSDAIVNERVEYNYNDLIKDFARHCLRYAIQKCRLFFTVDIDSNLVNILMFKLNEC